jgi:DNA repair exonuclease SbcCD ATPase subunit/DNA repair exonuclease SbcCD nuclease subunit
MIDTFEKLPTKLDKIDYIVHVSDVHIRLTKRHDEYREAFSKLYSEIQKTPENTVIINTGDTFHSKVDLSPEAVQIGGEFLKKCADIRPTIIIAGNHDCLLTNTTRLDSISPIVDALNHSNLFYLKESKLYGFANLLLNNMSVFDDATKYIRMKNVMKRIKINFDAKIALYHGGVLNAKTDVGYTITDKTVTNELFDGHDMALLGDIHMAQTLQEYDENTEKPIIRFAGSFIQQNHGEALLGHGYSLWNVKQRSYTHVEIPNDYGHFTIDIEDGKLSTDISTLPKKPKLRVRCKESVATEVKKVINELRKTYEISDLIYVRVDTDGATKVAQTQNISNLNQIGNVDYQNKIIANYLKDKFVDVMDDETIDGVCKINKELNAGLSRDDSSRNIRWRPIKFEFSNMFSYGENNVLDFTKLEDVYGVFAANASGKSSLMDALCFTVFDKSARAFKATHVMNSQKMSFNGKFTFEINNIKYVIERDGKRDKKNNVKVDVNFYKIEKDEKISLNSEARRSTNEIIRDYLGDYDDFVLTTLALQGNQGSFIDMGQTERKELLSQFIGLNLFDKLSSLAADKTKELSGAIKSFNKENSQSKLDGMKNELGLLESKLIDLNTQKEYHTSEKQKIDGRVEEEQSKVIKLEDVPTNISVLKSDRDTLIAKNNQIAEAMSKIDADTLVKKQEYVDAVKKQAEYPVDLKEKADKYAGLSRNKQRIEQEMEKLKLVVKEKLNKLDHLSKHQYDPNCRYCCNNAFVKDAISAKDSLETDKNEAKELSAALSLIKNELSELEQFVEQYQESLILKEKVNTLTAFLSKKELEKSNYNNNLEKNKTSISKMECSIELYEKSKEIIENNRVILEGINSFKSKSNELSVKLKGIEKEYVEAYSRKVSVGDQIKNIEEQIKKIQENEDELAAYQYYISAVGKDGVPYQIISDAIPKIEQEVNNILSHIVEFTISMETDGKNVNVYIKYEDKKWPLELCSGMEKFISGLALRVSLINISNLPRPNFLVIDEGMSALDATNMPMVHALFDYMKRNFDFIIIISHLDAMRDMVNKQLEIKKVNGFSNINHV